MKFSFFRLNLFHKILHVVEFTKYVIHWSEYEIQGQFHRKAKYQRYFNLFHKVYSRSLENITHCPTHQTNNRYWCGKLFCHVIQLFLLFVNINNDISWHIFASILVNFISEFCQWIKSMEFLRKVSLIRSICFSFNSL